MNPADPYDSYYSGMDRPAADMAPEGATPARFSADEFLHMYELGAFAGRAVELVDGEITELSPAHARHASAVMRVARWFLSKVREDRLFADAFIRLGGRSVRAFDVTVTRAGARPENVLLPEQVLIGIEVAESSIDRDLGSKMLDYARAGIEAYMVVDLTRDAIHYMEQPSEAGYGKVRQVRFGEPIDLPGDLGQLLLD